MQGINRADIRFNMEKDADRSAWLFLHDSDRSYSKTVIAALNAYAALKTEQERQEAFLRQIIETIQRALESGRAGTALPVEAEDQFDDDRVDILDFIDQLNTMGAGE